MRSIDQIRLFGPGLVDRIHFITKIAINMTENKVFGRSELTATNLLTES